MNAHDTQFEIGAGVRMIRVHALHRYTYPAPCDLSEFVPKQDSSTQKDSRGAASRKTV
ncbi:hypothetical protein RB195_019740 [Necator americanus]|uniref:Uncharacterized protein n=1 Tax=Necator americanus TaxID=51031 RepID=A0ABR1CJ54_NECAM